ncbi:phage tail protein [Vibrio neptunius]|uniref:phage tail protein n=1 Tax=Vibrio neptunius TaxID=170651 RepID=UPI003CE53FAB
MKALQSLTDLFKQHVVDANRFDAWAEDGAIFCTQGDEVDGFEVEYTAILFIHNAQLNPDNLFMHIVSWLNQYDQHRSEKGLAMPSFAIEPLDKGRYDLKLKLDIREEYSLVKDEQGDWKQADARFRCDNQFEAAANEQELGELIYFVGHENDLPCQNSH